MLENRYTVIKNSDIERAFMECRITTEQINQFVRFLDCVNKSRYGRGKEEIESVVIESDWPEYEEVVKMLMRRIEVGEAAFEKNIMGRFEVEASNVDSN